MDIVDKITETAEAPEKCDLEALLRPIAERIVNYENEISQLKADSADVDETINYYKKSALRYKNKIQARQIMEVVLPYVSDMFNEITDSQNLEDLKILAAIRFEELVRDLEYLGITLRMHEKGETVDPSYVCNVRPVPTTDEEKNQQVAKCTRIGCTFNDGTDPILEGLDIYNKVESEEKSSD